MAENGANGPDRRAMIGMAAAGVMLSSVCAAADTQGPTHVTVDLGDIHLPEAIARTMELQIRRAVLMAVAQAYPHTKFKSLPLPTGTRGIALRPA
jgi:hypothetical protein